MGYGTLTEKMKKRLMDQAKELAKKGDKEGIRRMMQKRTRTQRFCSTHR